jgi:hypothetical protein
LNELVSAFAWCEGGAADPDRSRIWVCCERGLDRAEASGRIFQRCVRQHVQEVVAAEANAQVAGAKLSTNRLDHPSQQSVARRAAAGVVDVFEADDIDVGDSKNATTAAGAIDLVIETSEARRPCARTGQSVSLCSRHLSAQGRPSLFDVRAITCSPFATGGSLFAVSRGAKPAFTRRGAGSCGPPAKLGGARHTLPARCRSLVDWIVT